MISSAIGFRVEGAVPVDLIDSQKIKETVNVNSSGSDIEKAGLTIADLSDIPNLYLGVFDISDSDYLFYRDQIVAKGDHLNYLCEDSPIGPVSVSLLFDQTTQQYVALLRTCESNRRVFIHASEVPKSWWRKAFGAGPSVTEVLKSLSAQLPVEKLRLNKDPRLPQALLSMEEQQQIKGFKFGILYAKEGQTKEDEMFANVESSPLFEEFLDFLGTRIKLDNWPNFKGGLDVKTGTTGTHTIGTKFNNNEIVYHVSTMLPFNQQDKQQLERKRHIGNDIVVIMFQEGTEIYKPTTISSRQVHVVFLVRPLTIHGERYYRLAVISKDGVPEFGPTMPVDAVFKKGEDFRNFFYVKLLNAEKASYSAPILNNKLTRTRTSLLRDIAANFV